MQLEKPPHMTDADPGRPEKRGGADRGARGALAGANEKPTSANPLRLILVFALLYAFLVSIKLMETAFKGMGSGSADGLLAGVTNPFAGLTLGILTTVLVQSSSVTTSMIVALVASGEVTFGAAVPMVMGANIGTTVTNTVVSIAAARRSSQFYRAFSCATVHDVFNIIIVAVLLPLELLTGFLSKSALWLSDILASTGSSGVQYKSPIKASVKAGGKQVQELLEATGLEGTWLHVMEVVVGLALIFVCLRWITVHMKALLINRIEHSLNRALARSGLIGMAIGALITVSVQSSSITTSLLVPMCAAGILTLDNAYPLTLGANVGTTVTALLASMASDNPLALAIALVHLLFNVSGIMLLYPVPSLRAIPIRGARLIALLAVRNKLWIIAYVGVVFVVVPLLGFILFK